MLTSSCRLHPAYRTQLRGKLPADATWRVTTGRCCNRSTAIHGCTCARAGQAGHATASCWLAGRATDAPPPGHARDRLPGPRASIRAAGPWFCRPILASVRRTREGAPDRDTWQSWSEAGEAVPLSTAGWLASPPVRPPVRRFSPFQQRVITQNA
jgi:hypothetical protein